MPPRGRCGASPCPWSSSRRRESGNTGEGPVRTSQDRPGRRNASEAPPVKRGVTVEYAGRHAHSITPPGNSMFPFPGPLQISPSVPGRTGSIMGGAMPDAPDSFDRIVEQCILMEIQAMSLYTTLANRVEDEETARVLRYLAEMEESHVGRLVEIFSGAGGKAGRDLHAGELHQRIRW